MDNTELFHNLVNFAAVDNKFTDEEIDFLVDRANQWGIPNEEFETAMAGLSSGEAQVTIPESHGDRVRMLKELLRLMAADGELAESEKRLCARISGRMDFTTEQFRQILDEVLKG